MLQPSGVRRRRPHRLLGLVLVAAGVLLVVAAGGYYLYGWIASRDLDSLKYVSDAASLSQDADSVLTLEELQDEASLPLPPEASRDDSVTLPDPASYRLYPGEWLAFNSWVDPWAAAPPSILDEELAGGFLPVGQFVLGKVGTLPPATRISIPAIELEADVQELKIQDLGDSLQYETPNRVVGHIPDTANPGETGNSWLFGHLQSPIRNEGSVFLALPQIPEVLRTGQRVYVVLESSEGSYLYEVYETDVVHKDDFRLYDTEDATVTLVTCVPRWKYDNRLLVTARLVGFRAGA